MKIKLMTGAAFAALTIPGAAYAQSTGTVETESREVVVTGTRGQPNVGGFTVPDTTKTKSQLNQAFISKQAPGQSVDELINQLPGVSFQNNDPYGSAGGTLTIRGFDSSRISQTIDGIPLNDTGNYAIYSNQQLDPELIEQVTVNLGSTDIDSPTASATGSTVNYRTVRPTDKFGVRVVGSVGDFNMMRIFGQVNTGIFTSFGTKAWVAASNQNYNFFANDFGRIRKDQYNAEIYQPIGGNGDFVSVAGNYNVNRNNFAGSIPLRSDTTVIGVTGTAPNQTLTSTTRTVGTGSGNRFPASQSELPYHVARCQTATPRSGVADVPLNVSDPTASNNGMACGASYDERYNPSNTGTIRVESRFTLAPGLVLSITPSFSYTKANGGGTVTGYETAQSLTNATGYTRPAGFQTAPFYGVLNTGPNTGNFSPSGFFYSSGVDLNGDGDTRDQVTLLAPSQTVTHRYIILSSLRYDLSSTSTVRVNYSHDYGRHRQTGELGYLQSNGVPVDVFPINNPIRDALGNPLEKRDRLSYAVLDQASGEYVGKFFDQKLVVDLGVTAKFFKRNLQQNCFTVAANGNVACIDPTQVSAYAAANPYLYVAPGQTATLPNGVTFNGAASAAGASLTNTGTAPIVFGFAPPQYRQYTYNRVLPQGGFVYHITPALEFHANYSKNIQVPGTDNLYQEFYFPRASASANPTPETSDNIDAGLRYTRSNINIEVSPFYTKFHNRLASSFDPDTQATFYRNLGEVTKYGVDAQVDYRPIPQVMFHAFGEYLHSRIKDNIVLASYTGVGTSVCNPVAGIITCNGTTQQIALTAGKRESGAPVYEVGGRVEVDLAPFELGAQIKRTGRRYVNDQNTPQYQSYTQNGSVNYYQVYGAYAPGYTMVDLDARVGLEWAGLNKTTYLQFNLLNAFNTYWVGGYTGGSTSNTSSPVFAQIGYPRTVMASINVQF